MVVGISTVLKQPKISARIEEKNFKTKRPKKKNVHMYAKKKEKKKRKKIEKIRAKHFFLLHIIRTGVSA